MLTHIEKLRALIAAHMTPEAPLSQALSEVADALEVDYRGQEAIVERVETLEERIEDLAAHNTTTIRPEIP